LLIVVVADQAAGVDEHFGGRRFPSQGVNGHI
jgi:hypothetical protein